MSNENHPNIELQCSANVTNHNQPARFVEQPLSKSCSNCGSEDCGMEAAVQWDIARQDWIVSTIYDKSGFCNTCGATNGGVEIEDSPAPDDYECTFTVLVRQLNGRGTTHISIQTASNHALALQDAKKQASADWGDWPIETITGVGIIAGEVDVVACDDEAETA